MFDGSSDDEAPQQQQPSRTKAPSFVQTASTLSGPKAGATTAAAAPSAPTASSASSEFASSVLAGRNESKKWGGLMAASNPASATSGQSLADQPSKFGSRIAAAHQQRQDAREEYAQKRVEKNRKEEEAEDVDGTFLAKDLSVGVFVTDAFKEKQEERKNRMRRDGFGSISALAANSAARRQQLTSDKPKPSQPSFDDFGEDDYYAARSNAKGSTLAAAANSAGTVPAVANVAAVESTEQQQVPAEKPSAAAEQADASEANASPSENAAPAEEDSSAPALASAKERYQDALRREEEVKHERREFRATSRMTPELLGQLRERFMVRQQNASTALKAALK